jgi:hypothetical protein
MAKPIAARGDVRSSTAGRKGQWWIVGLRLLISIGGGYAASSALVAGLARALPLFGLARSEAAVLASMLGFVVYLLILILGLARRNLARFALELLAMTGIGLLLAFYAGA